MFEIVSARADDLPLIDDLATRFKLDRERLAADQFVVVRGAAGGLRGFGRIKPYDGVTYELGTVGVQEEERGRGLGDAIVRHLMRAFPSEDVWITTDLHAYFERFGFARVDGDAVPAVLADKLQRICGSLRQNVVAMRAARPPA